MAGSEDSLLSPHYPWRSIQDSGKMDQMHQTMDPSYNGLSTTSGPSALDNGSDDASASIARLYDSTSAQWSGFDFPLSQETNPRKFHYPKGRGLGSGQVTPGEGFGTLSCKKITGPRSSQKFCD